MRIEDGSLLELMLVDDNDDDIYLIAEAFKKSKYFRVTLVARDGEEAIDILQGKASENGKSLALMLLDINLPRIDGFQVLERLRPSGTRRSLPVLVLTTSAREEDVARALGLGANSYLQKPATPEGLRELVRNIDLYWGETVLLPQVGCGG